MVKLTRIYTKTGDDGTTGLVSGARIPKTDPRIGAIGAVDELNAILGTALAALPEGSVLVRPLQAIQNDLFDLGADLATPGDIEGALRVTAGQVAWLEQQIDALNEDLPALTSFILPSGGSAVAALHHARAVARRAEREAWLLNAAEAAVPVPVEITSYLNRLSDLLFVAARKAALMDGGEVLWQPGAGHLR